MIFNQAFQMNYHNIYRILPQIGYKKPMKKLALLLILIALSASQETFVGRIFAGYQGWFTHPDDGTGNSWTHWKMHNERPFARDNCVIDFFPITDEYERKYAVPEMPGWSVFSAADYSTVRLHFKWVQDAEIHGLFLQRFGGDIRDKGSNIYRFKNKVFENVMNAAKEADKLWCLMYDLTGMRAGEIRSIIMDDFRYLKRAYPGFMNHPTYVKHKGKPLVTIYGVGYNDNREYTLAQSAELVDFLKNDPEFGGHTINLSTPRYWREGGRDAVTGNDLKIFHNIILKSDAVTPWAVGRYRTIDQARTDARVTVKGDVAWCNQNKLVLMPVIFPGFSWHNLQVSGENPDHPGPYNEIPRQQGGLYFLQEQGVEVIKAGARTIYVAMFDEMNEGTAIFKCATNPPSLADGLQFVPYENDPGFYLRMTGNIGKMIP